MAGLLRSGALYKYRSKMLTKETSARRILKKLGPHTAQSVLDSLTENLAVLNARGIIVSVNSAWMNFASGNGGDPLDRASVGENYPRAFREAFGKETRFAKASRAIGSVITGDRERFSIEYPCHLPDQKRWFRLSVTQLKKGGMTSGAVVSHSDITRRKLAELETRRLAVIDPMTGILNRKAGLEYIRKQIKAARRRKRSLTVCFIDLDNLKYVNDNYGHREGDRTIRAAVKLMKNVLRETDAMCRLGGDEIIIVLTDTPAGETKPVLDRIAELIARRNEKARIQWKLEFSYGLAEYTLGSKLTAEELVDIADRNMYKMKMSKKYKKGVN
ncbi:MAG: diguanylate cyclase [Thermodesulfobacteriota bacterium]